MNKSSLDKEKHVLNISIAKKWCVVDINNKFKFMNTVFVIDEYVEEYKVYKKSSEVDEYENEAYMDSVLAVINKNYELVFYNQNFEEITNMCHISGEEK